jgi:hypothetical protein
LQAEKQSGEKQAGGLASGHKSGGLVLVLALGPSTRPKNAIPSTFLKQFQQVSLFYFRM